MNSKKYNYIDPKLIPLKKKFVDMFPVDQNTKSNIIESIKKNGWDKDQEIILARIIGNNSKFCIDGHQRRLSAIESGLQRVTYIVKEFNSEEDAYSYALNLQFNRRNLTEKEKLNIIINDGFWKTAKNKKKYIAEKLHIGERTAVKYLKILNDNDRLQLVLNDDETINSAIKAKSEKQTEHKVVKDIKKIAKSIPDDISVEELEQLDIELKAIRKRMREVRR